ncbi:hypothetical protein DWUX_2347 [Desulfovibrio diazotrophicus]|nr:hypothetical protein DWUX_2347 [Desulfovibrio diazotrophicus]
MSEAAFPLDSVRKGVVQNSFLARALRRGLPIHKENQNAEI